jgi:hypothetical protein
VLPQREPIAIRLIKKRGTVTSANEVVVSDPDANESFRQCDVPATPLEPIHIDKGGSGASCVAPGVACVRLAGNRVSTIPNDRRSPPRISS